MPSVGDRLRAEREKRRLTIQQVAEATNMKSDHVRAIEAGQWDAFAAPVYIRGFVRTYARFLRLDDKAAGKELEAETEGLSMYDGPPELALRRKGPLDWIMLWLSRAPWPWIFPIAVGLAAALTVSWAVWGNHTPAKRTVIPETGSTLYQPRTKRSEVMPLPQPTNAAGRRGP